MATKDVLIMICSLTNIKEIVSVYPCLHNLGEAVSNEKSKTVITSYQIGIYFLLVLVIKVKNMIFVQVFVLFALLTPGTTVMCKQALLFVSLYFYLINW